MEFKIKSVDPKSHITICSSINIFGSHIIDSGIFTEKDGEIYGFFKVQGSPDMIESLYHIPGIILEISKEFPSEKDI